MTQQKDLMTLLPLIRSSDNTVVADEMAYYFLLGNLLGDLSLHKPPNPETSSSKSTHFEFDQASLDLTVFFRQKAKEHGLLPDRSVTLTVKGHKTAKRCEPEKFLNRFAELERYVGSVEETLTNSDTTPSAYATHFRGFGVKLQNFRKKHIDTKSDYDLSYSFATRKFNASNWDNTFYTVRPKKKTRSFTVPENIQDLFTSPYALAMWFLGDGWIASDCRNIHFAGGEWGEDEITRMQKCLYSNFHLKTSTVKGQQGGRTHRFTILAESYNTFYEHVKPHICELESFVGTRINDDPYFKHKLFD